MSRPGVSSQSLDVAARVIEASWLIAVAVVPLLHDPHGALGFDPIKIAVLRGLGLMVGAMLVVRAAGWLSGGGKIPRPPFWASACLLLWISAAASCLVSIDPQRSVWGSPQFQQGLWTLSCNLVLFVGVATHLRTAAQRRRLVGAVLAGSAPVVVYSLAQHMGIERSGVSFAGHRLYLAGYLLLVMPLCVWRLWQACTEWRREQKPGYVIVYGILLTMQFAAFMATEKRGPLVALVLGSGAGVVLLAGVSGRLRFARIAIALCAGALTALVALAALREAGAPIERIPLAGRLSRTIPLGSQTGDRPRDTMWREALSMMTGWDPIVVSDGSADSARALRPWLGFGPETLQRVLIQRWQPHVLLPVAPAESRFHNSFWDTWQAVGLLGLIASLAIFLAVFREGCRSTNLLQRSRVVSSVAVAGASGALAGGAMAFVYGVGYFGVGFMIGFAGGAVLHAFRSAMRRESSPVGVGADSAWIIAVLVALIAHWIDMVFVFETASTLALAWILAGAVVGTGHNMERAAEPDDSPWAPVTAVGLFAGLMLAVILNGFLDVSSVEILTPSQVLWTALTTAQATGRPTGLLLAVLLISGVAILWMLGSATGFRKRRDFALAALVALAFALAFAWMKSAWLAGTGPIPGVNDTVEVALRQAGRLEWVSPVLLGGCLAVACIVAVAGRAVSPAMGILLAGVLLLAWRVNLSPLRTGAADGWGDLLLSTGRFGAAAAVYDRALAIDPSSDATRVQLAAALIESAERTSGAGSVTPLMARAAEVLETGRRIGWVNRGDFQLGRVYLRWALAEPATEERVRLTGRAADAFEQAIRFDPFSAPIWFEASLADRLLLGDEISADAKVERANAITMPPPEVKFDAAQWGYHYAELSKRSANAPLRDAYGRRALMYFDRSLNEGQEVEESPKMALRAKEKEYRVLLTMGGIRRDLGEQKDAVGDYLRAARIESGLGTWEAEGRLAETLATMGEYDAALSHVERALADAPPEVREDLERIRVFLLKKP